MSDILNSIHDQNVDAVVADAERILKEILDGNLNKTSASTREELTKAEASKCFSLAYVRIVEIHFNNIIIVCV